MVAGAVASAVAAVTAAPAQTTMVAAAASFLPVRVGAPVAAASASPVVVVTAILHTKTRPKKLVQHVESGSKTPALFMATEFPRMSLLGDS